MATFEKGILGGFSGKVGNVVGARWRGKNIMRSLPQRGSYVPTQEQLEQREKFALVIDFLGPLKPNVGTYFGKKQGDKSVFNLATGYHLREAVLPVQDGFVIDYLKVLISKGDLRGLVNTTLTANANQVLDITWDDNSGQGNATAQDLLYVAVYVPEADIYQLFTPAGTRSETQVFLTLPAYLTGLEAVVWATFISPDLKEAATSSYLGTVTVS